MAAKDFVVGAKSPPDSANGLSENPNDVEFLIYVDPGKIGLGLLKGNNWHTELTFGNNDQINKFPLVVSKATKVLIHGLSSHLVSEFKCKTRKLGLLDLPDKNQWYTKLAFGNNDEITKFPLDVSKRTKVLIHGLSSGPFSEFPQNVANAYLRNQYKHKHNVIIVDWSMLAGHNPVFYLHVLPRLRIVGERVGNFLLWLEHTKELDLRKVHIVGHSLGAHVAGLATQTMNDAGWRIGRISALDPAGPGFFTGWFNRSVEKNDADFVDAYHTNAGMLGTSHLVGDVDFFINGGSEQPNHSDDFTGEESHSDAHRIFAQTILDGPRKNRVTNLALLSQADHDFVDSNIDLDSIFGEYCPPGTRGRYDIKYDNIKRAVIDDFV